MKLIIKEWPDQSATLMTENGYSLATFNNSAEAQQACEEWRQAHQEHRNIAADAPLMEAIHA